MSQPVNSLVVPVYRNRDSVARLIKAVGEIRRQVAGGFEAIFVVDGSPDDSGDLLREALKDADFPTRVVEHSRNFGSFAAIRTGLELARGSNIAVMAADLQEPLETIVEFFRRLQGGEVDVVVGQRTARNDRGDAMSKLYWRLYRRFVIPDIPPGGVDVFACTAAVRNVICSLESANTSLIAQLFWVGFRRDAVPYERRPSDGPSGWTFRRKLRYLSDSVFAFTDLPVRVLWLAGALGLVLGMIVGAAVLIGHLAGTIDVPGYTATVLVIVFFASLNMLGLGIIGSYVWRGYETGKGRPGAVVRDIVESPGRTPDD